MHRALLHKWKFTLGVILFLTGQAFSLAHAAEFSSLPHDHDGVTCVAILNDEQDGLIPAAACVLPTGNYFAASKLTTPSASPLLRLRAFRPPATGPPSI